jgi:hypothetical protein
MVILLVEAESINIHQEIPALRALLTEKTGDPAHRARFTLERHHLGGYAGDVFGLWSRSCDER